MWMFANWYAELNSFSLATFLPVSVEGWEADYKNLGKKPARAGWPRRLALVRATPRAQVDVIGAQLCSCTRLIFAWLTLSWSDCSSPLIIVDNSPSMHNTGFFPDCQLLSVTDGFISYNRGSRTLFRTYLSRNCSERSQPFPCRVLEQDRLSLYGWGDWSGGEVTFEECARESLSCWETNQQVVGGPRASPGVCHQGRWASDGETRKKSRGAREGGRWSRLCPLHDQ